MFLIQSLQLCLNKHTRKINKCPGTKRKSHEKVKNNCINPRIICKQL